MTTDSAGVRARARAARLRAGPAGGGGGSAAGAPAARAPRWILYGLREKDSRHETHITFAFTLIVIPRIHAFEDLDLHVLY